MTQTEQVLAHLKSGKTITPLGALDEYGIFRLGARIYDLKRQGYQIQMRRVPKWDKSGHYAEYRLEAARRT